MTPAPEVDFILTSIANNYGTALSNVPLQRIDRDNSENIDTGERRMAEEDYNANYVSAGSAETQSEAIGTEYNQRVQAVVNVRLQGTHHAEHGNVDPDGTNGAVWQDMVRRVKRAIMLERTFPDVANAPNTTYCWIDERNERDLSADFKDRYRWEADYVFIGYDDIPTDADAGFEQTFEGAFTG